MMLRLAKRFGATSSLRLGSSKYLPYNSWLRKGLHDICGSFQRLESLDLIELAPELFSPFGALNLILGGLVNLKTLKLRLPHGLLGMDRSEHIADILTSAAKHCPKLEKMDIRPGSSACALVRDREDKLGQAYGELLRNSPALKSLCPVILSPAGGSETFLGKVLEVRSDVLSLTLCGYAGGWAFL